MTVAVARVHGAALWGVEPRLLRVEVAVGRGLPALEVVGLSEAAAREARFRVRAALRALGLRLPPARITVNLAPAELPKQGTAYDLAVAAALLAATGRVATDPGCLYVGELALDGSVRPVRGVLAAALRAREAGIGRAAVPAACAAEVRAVRELRVRPVGSLRELVDRAGSGPEASGPARESEASMREDAPASLDDDDDAGDVPDWAAVRGQLIARRALEIAAAGGHHTLLVGTPGVGKTLLLHGFPGVLPPLGDQEALEVTALAGTLSLRPPGAGLVRRRPWRMPHHSLSRGALLGGGNPPLPGELTLAHRGVLIADELALFRREVLEALRQPLEEGVVRVPGRGGGAVFPARVQLVAAMNPCPCGHAGGEGPRACTCAPGAVRRYRAAVSGALLDRFDLIVWMGAAGEIGDGAGGGRGSAGEPSSAVRARVTAARALQAARAQGGDDLSNGELRGRLLLERCRAAPEALRLLALARSRLGLTGRGEERVLRVARTIADLAGRDRVEEPDVAEALQYRVEPWH